MTDQIAKYIEDEPVAAALEQVAGRWVLTMTRDFGYPPERLWRMLTEPERLATWSPVVPDRPLTTVGPASSPENPDAAAADVEVLVCDEPRELIHRWGTHLLRWTLVPTPTGTRLTIADTLDEFSDGSRNGAGWHICLAVLAAYLDDPTVKRVVGSDADSYGWASLNERYDKLLTVS